MRLEVRCCCLPQKLLGWLDVPSELVFRGNVIGFRIPPRCYQPEGQPIVFERAIAVKLPIEQFVDYRIGDAHLALKSEETPIDVLRRVPGFEENTAGAER